LLAALSLSGLACLQPRPTGANAVRNSPMSALPERSAGLLVVEVGSLRDRRSVTRWMSDLAARAEMDGAMRSVFDRFGRRILERLERLALVVVPIERGQTGFALMAEGDLDEATLLQSMGGARTVTLLEIADQPDVSVTILSGGTLVIGPLAVLNMVQDNAPAGAGERFGAGGLQKNGSLMSLLDRVDARSQIWGAIDYAPLANLAGRFMDGSDLSRLPIPSVAPGALQALAFQSTLGDPISFDIIGRSALEDDARRLADAARGLVAIGRMAAGREQTQEWLALLDAITISQSGALVTVHGTVSEETLSQIAEGIEAPEMPPVNQVVPPPASSGKAIPPPAPSEEVIPTVPPPEPISPPPPPPGN
jgi:hypothetical protein